MFSQTKLVKDESESLNDVDESSFGKANNSVVVIEVMDTSDEDDIGESNVNGGRNVKGEPSKGNQLWKLAKMRTGNENQPIDHGRIER